MKTQIISFLSLVAFLITFNSCNEPLIENQGENSPELKGGRVKTVEHIVHLNKESEFNKEEIASDGGLTNDFNANNDKIEALAVAVLSKHGISSNTIGKVFGNSIWGFTVNITVNQAELLESTEDVLGAARNWSINTAGLAPKKKPRPDPTPDPVEGQETPASVLMVLGENLVPKNDDTKRVWILDTGVSQHDDLNVISGKSFVDYTSSTNDDNGHGTHVAGIIAAKNNDIGVVGISPGATIIPIKILDRGGSGREADALAAMDYVAFNCQPGDVILMAFHGNQRDYIDSAAVEIAKKDAKIAIAAGNMHWNANARSPASANHSNIYTVSACDIDGNFWENSNHGNPPVDICAPGIDVRSTSKNGSYEMQTGTSMSAAHVAGLLLQGWDGEFDKTVIGDPDDIYHPDGYRVYTENIGGIDGLNGCVSYHNAGYIDPIAKLGGDFKLSDYLLSLDVTYGTCHPN